MLSIEFHRESLGDVYDPGSPGWVSADQRVVDDENGVRFFGVRKDGPFTVAYDDIPGNSWNPQRLSKFVERANQLLVNRTPIDSLPPEDELAQSDPANPPHLYWDGGDVCSQKVEIVSAALSPLGHLLFEWRRLSP